MFALFLARLIRPLIFGNTSQSPTTRCDLKVKPRLTELESREVPYRFTWLGGAGTPTLLGYDAQNPYNWDTNAPLPQYLQNSGIKIYTPGVNDDVYFEGAVSSTDTNCDMTGSNVSASFKSLTMWNGYTATVTTKPVSVATLTVSSGTINPKGTAAGDLSVTQQFNWNGGVLNDTTYRGAVKMYGANATITPPAMGALTTGDTLSFAPSGTVGSTCTFVPGTINFNNNASVWVDSLSNIQINPTAAAPVVFNGQGSSTVGILGGLVTASTTDPNGAFNATGMSLQVQGGTFKNLGGMTSSFTGSVGGVVGAESGNMSSGSIAIQNLSTVAFTNGLVATGGRVSTLENSQYPTATIDGNFWNAGADVIILDGSLGRPMSVLGPNVVCFCRLYVDGDVSWSGGTYKPAVYDGLGVGVNVDATIITKSSDVWSATGTFTISGNPPIIPSSINSAGGVGGVVKVQQAWSVIYGSALDVVPGGMPTVAAPWIGVGTGNWNNTTAPHYLIITS